MVQLSHPYMTTGKTTALTKWTFVGKMMFLLSNMLSMVAIALTRWNFVGKAMSLLFNMLSRLVITFLPKSKCLLISWLQSPSAVILEPKKIKSVTVYTVPHLFAMK